jgi:2-phosphosulfolactate phosphatase
MKKKEVSCCFSPALLPLFDFSNHLVVVIDIFRATSTIAAALGNGADKIIPVDNVEECIEIGAKTPNSITAGERNGQIVEGLQMGNSPSAYPAGLIQGKTLVLTTTNGTRLLHKVKEAPEILSGAFLNLSATADYIRTQQKDVLLACASWKDRFNLEDTLFAGALFQAFGKDFHTNCDSTIAASALYDTAKSDLFGFLRKGSHFHRLEKFGLEKDLRYCCQIDEHDMCIKYDGEALLSL